ncbi:MAG: hypothetical protein J7J32_06725 [Candidatus Atribacteria bacterium]|nr:hypothetical protein [Candidatus Atribacteria bacterium]MCD6349460.1 hypothetical protein [Candidatus Atribacteria bacterium]
MRRFFFFALLFFLVGFLSFSAFAVEDVVSLIQKAPSFYAEEDKEYLLQRIPEILEEVRQEGISPEPLILKLGEGLRKQVLPYNLVKTLERKKDSLLLAKKALQRVDARVASKEDLLYNLALVFESAASPEELQKVLEDALRKDGKRLESVIDSLAAFVELGFEPGQAGLVIAGVVRKGATPAELKKLTRLLERARREGIDPSRVAAVLKDAISKYDHLSMVEMEVKNLIASSRQRPNVEEGEGVVISSPGITSSSTPTQEGGAPLEGSNTPSGPPTQEGGIPLE